MLLRASISSGSLTRSILASVESQKNISSRLASTQSTKSETSTPEAKVWMTFLLNDLFILTGLRMKLKRF